jgi:hypothetical protein
MSDPDRIVRLDLSVSECALISLALGFHAVQSSGMRVDLPPLPPEHIFAMRDIVRKIEREVLRG